MVATSVDGPPKSHRRRYKDVIFLTNCRRRKQVVITTSFFWLSPDVASKSFGDYKTTSFCRQKIFFKNAMVCQITKKIMWFDLFLKVSKGRLHDIEISNKLWKVEWELDAEVFINCNYKTHSLKLLLGVKRLCGKFKPPFVKRNERILRLFLAATEIKTLNF